MKNILNNRVTDSNKTTLDFHDRNRYYSEYIMVNYKWTTINYYACISRLFSKDELPCMYHCGAKKRTIRYLCVSGKLSRKGNRRKRNIRDYCRG